MHHGQRYHHGGAFQIEKFEEYLFVERFRNSPSYMESWQKDWKLIWMQPRNKSCLNLTKLSEQKLLIDSINMPELYHYQQLYDAAQESSILGLQIAERLPDSFSSIQNVGEFMHYAKTFNGIQQEMGCQFSQDIDGLNYVMNAAADSHLQHLNLSLPSNSDGEDPLLTFDNPLWRMHHVELAKKLPTTHIGPAGVVTPFNSLDQDFSSISVCHVGCTAWIIIHHSCSERLLQKIGECIYLKQDVSKNTFNCYIANRRYSITLEQLEQWAIRYTVIFQEEGDTVILFPGAIYGTCNLSFCINSSMKFLTLFNEDAKEKPEITLPNEHSQWQPLTIDKAIWDWMYVALLLKVDDSVQLATLPPATTVLEDTLEIPSGGESFTSDSILSVLTSVAFPLEDTANLNHDPSTTISNPSLDDYNCCLSPASLFENLFDSDTSTDTVFCENASITWNGNGCNTTLPLPVFDCNPNPEGHEFVTKYREICTEMGGLSVERFPSESEPCVQTPGFLMGSDPQKDSDSGCQFSTTLELAPTFLSATEDIAYTVATSVMSSQQFEYSTIEKGALNTLVSNDYANFVLTSENLMNNNNTEGKLGDEDQIKNGVECPQCCRQLSNKSHLKRHMYLKHSASNISVQCPICLKMFANEISLQRHRGSVSRNPTRKRNLCRGLTERISNDNRLRCSICGQLFVLKSGLNRHLKNIHNKSPYKDGQSL